MIKVLYSKFREEVKHNNIKEFCSFSCGSYQHDRWQDWGSLLVLNEVWINPNEGLPMQAHSNTEIVTIVMKGELTHLDTEGHKKTLVPNEIQVMSAGRGVLHSELNSGECPIHLYRLWFCPSETETLPEYHSRVFDNKEWRLVVSPENHSSLKINQNCRIFLGDFESGNKNSHECLKDKMYWLQVICGEICVNGVDLEKGDGAGIRKEDIIEINSKSSSQVILVEVDEKIEMTNQP